MILDMFYRGFTLSYAVQESFFQVYLPSSGWTGEEGLSTITRNWDRWSAESEPVGTWYRPISWPVPLSTNLMTFESSRAFWLRDMGPMLRMIGHACECIPGDDFLGMFHQLLGFDWVQFSFASIIMLPGDYLSRLLCGSVASSTSRMVEGSLPYFQLNLKAIEVALHVYLEGTKLDHKQIEYLLHLLQRCLNFCRRLGLSDSGHIALLDTHLHHCMRLAQTHCNIPVLDRLTSRMRSVVKQGVGLKLVMDRMKEEMVEVGPVTILQLSCWRFHNVVSRNRFPVVHAVVDALWPFFAAALGLKGDFSSHYSSMLEYDSEKVRETCGFKKIPALPVINVVNGLFGI
jgi:hypothetical protein